MDTKFVNYMVKRILLALVTILFVITVTFFLMHAIPGGPFLGEKAITEEVQRALEKKYGLDKPLITQYFTYLGDLLRFDFGLSLKQRGMTVKEIIFSGFAESAKIGSLAALIAIIIGIILGSAAAVRRNKTTDKVTMVVSTAFVAVPSFVIGTFILLLFFIAIPKLLGMPAPGGYIFPILTLSLYPMAYITRLTRSSMLDVLGQDYIRTARAKGVTKNKVIFKHALKNALIPVLTYVGPMLAYILTGSLVVEKIFNVPGISRAFINSITNRDYPLIMGTTVFLASLIVIMNLVTDILYRIVDPRIDFS
ncbi:MAG: ABC transporter permease [Bacilli bacterium]|nr:ABC transporter permease [Bacilli bacterium]MDD4077930.1 ABC transporter permease [Bacilli bacterium]MDD4388243.1 ABC transporter permease [Bacilli bacterium]